MDDTASIKALPSRPANARLKEDEVLDIVVRVQNQDNEAFGELYRAYFGSVFRFIRNRVKDHLVAEDLASEVFLRALRGISGFTWQGHGIHAWLIAIARNLAADHLTSAPHLREVLVAELHDAECEAFDIDDLAVAIALEQPRDSRPGSLGSDQAGGVDLEFCQDSDQQDLAAQLGIAKGGRRVRDRQECDLLADRAVGHVTAEPSAEDVVISEQLLQQIYTGVLRLAPRQQECFILRSFHEQSIAHTAWIMGVSEGSVKMLQLRATRSLADMLRR